MHPAVLLAALPSILSALGPHATPKGLSGSPGPRAIPHAAVAQQGSGAGDPWSSDFGLPSADGVIECAAEYRGQLYVGGNFEQIDGVAAAHIARWDGQQWQPVGAGFDGDVYSFLVVGDRLL